MSGTVLFYPNSTEATMATSQSSEHFEFTEIPSPDSLFTSLTEVPEITSIYETLETPLLKTEYLLQSGYITNSQTLPSEVTSSALSLPFSKVALLDENRRSSSEGSFSSEVSCSEVTSGTSDLEALEKCQEGKSTSLKYPPCNICSGKASGLHYGCYTCEACKNFFRRYLIRNERFLCKKQGKCQVINRSRGNCSGCRLEKCLAVGMSKDKSKIGRYTHAQRTETIREVNKLEGKNYEDETNRKPENKVKTPDYVTKPLLETEETLYLETEMVPTKATSNESFEFELLDTLVESMDAIQHFGVRGSTQEGVEEIIKEHYDKYLAKVKLFGPLKAIPKQEYFTLLKMYNIDLDGRWNLFKQEANNCSHIVQRYCEFAQKIPGFSQLHPKSQENLLKFGHCDFFIILLHKGYMPEYNIFLEMNGVPSHVEEAADKIFSRELIELQVIVFLKWQKLKLTKQEMALLIAMSLVCRDRCDMEDPDIVEGIHSKLVNLLIKLMEKTHGSNAHRRFAKFVDVLIYNRLGSEKYFKEYKEMSQDEMVTETAPAFPTLCPDI